MTIQQAITHLEFLKVAGLLDANPNQIDNDALDMAINALKDRPTGEWKCFIGSAYYGVDEDNEPIWRERKIYHCPFCNRRTVIKENYCPNCGALMKTAVNLCDDCKHAEDCNPTLKRRDGVSTTQCSKYEQYKKGEKK